MYLLNCREELCRTLGTKKLVSYSPGLVDFAVGLVDFTLNLRKFFSWKVFWEFFFWKYGQALKLNFYIP